MNIIKLGIIFILIGFAFVLAGMLLFSNNAFGGFIMIGPIPIAFGSSPEITIVAMVIGLLLILVYLIGRRYA